MDKIYFEKKKNDWNKRWDSKPRLFSYLSPLMNEDFSTDLKNERKYKINKRTTRYYP